MEYATSLKRIILPKEIRDAFFGKTKSYSDYDTGIKSKLLKGSWTEVPLE